jgi:hypothetical protein
MIDLFVQLSTNIPPYVFCSSSRTQKFLELESGIIQDKEILQLFWRQSYRIENYQVLTETRKNYRILICLCASFIIQGHILI